MLPGSAYAVIQEFDDLVSAPGEGDESSKRIGQGWGKGFEWKGLRRVEACSFGSVEVYKRHKRVQRLIDRGPTQRSFIAVIVRGRRTFGDSLDAGYRCERATKLRSYVGTDNTS